MSTPAPSKRGIGFYTGFLVVALIIAGGLSYFASAEPDGLDSVTLEGCQTVEVGGEEQLDGACIAQNAQDSATAGSPLADYSIVRRRRHRGAGRHHRRAGHPGRRRWPVLAAAAAAATDPTVRECLMDPV